VGNQKSHRHHQQHRVPQRPLPPSRPGPGPLPDRPGHARVPLPGHRITGPHRPRQPTMDHPTEGNAQRVRHHLRKTHPKLRTLATSAVPAPDMSATLSDWICSGLASTAYELGKKYGTSNLVDGTHFEKSTAKPLAGRRLRRQRQP
jgi:hypothetical protein